MHLPLIFTISLTVILNIPLTVIITIPIIVPLTHQTPNIPLTLILTIPTAALLVVFLNTQLDYIITAPPLHSYNTYSLHPQYMFLTVSAYICILYDTVSSLPSYSPISAYIYLFYDTVSNLPCCFSPSENT